MDGWREWLFSLAGLVILINILSVLVPPGPLQKTAKLVFGLILLLAVLQPIVSIVLMDWQTDFNAMFDQVSTDPAIDWLQTGERIRQAGSAPLYSLVEAGLAQQLEALLLLEGGVADTAVRVAIGDHGNITAVEASVLLKNGFGIATETGTDAQSAATMVNLERIIASYLGVPPTMVVAVEKERGDTR